MKRIERLNCQKVHLPNGVMTDMKSGTMQQQHHAIANLESNTLLAARRIRKKSKLKATNSKKKNLK